jgi:hypothetical protein
MFKGKAIFRVYFAVISAIALIMLMISFMSLFTIGLKTYIFTQADAPEYSRNCPAEKIATIEDAEIEKIDCDEFKEQELADYRIQKANNAVEATAGVLVALPIFLLHFRVVNREWKEKQKKDKS